MYAGSTLPQLKTLDTWFGAHQKLDRLARRQLRNLLKGSDVAFPSTREILRFEGMDGPDGIKRKTPAQDEPWHFFDPNDQSDVQLFDEIRGHFDRLVLALRADSRTKASFEAAWLAHALVDGLTPAHHYPYEKELIRLRGGKGIETRTTPKEKIIMPGETLRKKLRNNWEMWGDKGLLATHLAFEWGIAVMILPMRSSTPRMAGQLPDMNIGPDGYMEYFKSQARHVAGLKLYEQFYESGWTPKMVGRVKKELVPIIVSTLAMIWYAAYLTAQESAR